ncbi:MAG: TonB-dependent receptor [Flavobacteriales bacterium]|nr:TonB-dependent receptor [Flavobacteriales bacterium]
MKAILLLPLTIMIISLNSAWAQNGTISGVVSDEFGELSGAKVELVGTNQSTYCDINGSFQLEVKPGLYTLKVSYLMYKSHELGVRVDFNNLNPELQIILVPGSTADEDVELGSRFAPKSQIESPVALELVSSEEIINSGYLSLSEVLMYLVPSFNSNRQTIADGTDHIAPSTVRGLGSDQFLVLIDGKRRHSSSLVNVNGTIGRGSVSTDLDAIPITAIDHIEIMRDGAGAQYGSDAIAGVINIILKDHTTSFSLLTAYQPTIAGDGDELAIGVNYGVGSGSGYLNFSTEFRNRESINRAGEYTGTVYTLDTVQDQQLIQQNDFYNQTGFEGKRTMEVGGASTFDGGIFLNGAIDAGDKAEVYMNGGFNYRQGMAHAFYRFPKEEDKVVLELHPDGFSPEIHTDILDRSITFGLRGKNQGWLIDLSTTLGDNSFDYSVRNSNNASMGIASPTDFYAGGFVYGQNITNLDFSKSLGSVLGLERIDLAFGSEFRVENYSIVAGDAESWIDGGDTLVDGTARVAGSQGFIGFQPENELDKRRTNAAVYGDIDWHILEDLLLETAIRYENYSDFGSNVNWKVASRYKIGDMLSIRGAVGTSFRAPSLQQRYFNNISTQFINDEAFQVGTFNNESAAANQFGIERLKAETSTNTSVGFTLKPKGGFTFNADGYYMKIKDRIVLSGLFSTGFESLLNPINVGAAQFFTNAANTETAGVDVSTSYNIVIKSGIIRISLKYNHSVTSMSDSVNVSGVLQGNAETLFNREEVSRLEVAQPRNKAILLMDYSMKKWNFSLRNTYFGSVTYIHPDDGDPQNWVLNEYTGKVESRDQTFKPKVLTDVNVNFRVNKNLNLSVGGTNIFNIYPDKHTHSANTNDGSIQYSRRVQQFGVRGAAFYVRMRMNL